MKYIIKGRLPSLNDIINACRTNWTVAAKQKKQNEQIISLFIPRADKPFDKRVMIYATFYEPNDKRDADNVSGGGFKFICDCLVAKGVIKDDSRKWVKGCLGVVETDKENARIEIEIREC